MADKEATAYIVDVGRSMGECRNGRSVTDLEWAMQYVWDRITGTVSGSRHNWTVFVKYLAQFQTRWPLAAKLP